VKVASFEAIVRALAAEDVRYLVAGGLAVNAHGYIRLTNDVDVVLDLDPANARRAARALTALGYRPAVPVKLEEFADPTNRARWLNEKGMQVFQLWSDRHRETPIDLFVSEPFDFDTEYGRAFVGELAPGLSVRFVALETLIRMKEAVGRPRDLDDVQHLRWILEDRGE
jgi:hypothetical protein